MSILHRARVVPGTAFLAGTILVLGLTGCSADDPAAADPASPATESAPPTTDPPSSSAPPVDALPAGLPLLSGHDQIEGAVEGGAPADGWAWKPCGTGAEVAPGGATSAEWTAEATDATGRTYVTVEQVVAYDTEEEAQSAMQTLFETDACPGGDDTETSVKWGDDLDLALGDQSLSLYTVNRTAEPQAGDGALFFAVREGRYVGLYGSLHPIPEPELHEGIPELKLARDFVAAVEDA